MATIVQPRRQRLDAQRNRDKILAAAWEAFTGGDASSVSMAEVARRAGVGVGTVYRHYRGRRHLLEAVFTDEVDAVCAQAADLAADVLLGVITGAREHLLRRRRPPAEVADELERLVLGTIGSG